MQTSNRPSKIQVPFATSGIKNTIPVASQIGITTGAASFTDGFPPLTFATLASGGVPPSGADFNGILNAITAFQQWQSGGGLFIYDSAWSTANSGYPKGAVLESSDGSTLWLSISDNNTTDPDGVSPSNWVSLAAYGIAAVTGLTNANVTLSPAQYGKNVITLSGTLTGNVQIIFPTTQRTWTVINNTSGSFTVICKTASGTGAAVAQGGQEIFYGDGTNLVQRLGNTPPQFDNSQKLITSAFLQRALGSCSNLLGIVGASTLTKSSSGVAYVASDASPTTLPLASSVLAGTAIAFEAQTTGSSLIASGTDNIAVGGDVLTSLSVGPGDSVTLLSDGVSNWFGFSGSAILPYSSLFSATLAPNGHKTTPSGDIEQWGVFTSNASAGSLVSVTFPIPFPTAVYSLVLTPLNPSTTATSAWFEALTTSGFAGHANVASQSVYYIAKGK